MIDISNVMVVLNSSCNVLIYFNYCKEFREVLFREKSKLRHLLFKHRRNIKFTHEIIAIGRMKVSEDAPRADDALLNKTDVYSLRTTMSCTDDSS
uniref:Uncharacterized protein n=1 Tax=Panagrellus redivivus TaxID=6233 RepID=A0A7E4VCF2_PANRE